MGSLDRRGFLRVAGGGALAALTPGTIGRALAIPADRRSGTITDVQHIVVLMQENRSFDHYFGTLRGVRGFGDPRAVTQANGRPIFEQPHGADFLTPFRPAGEDVGARFIEDLPHDWNSTHAARNDGRWDRWVAAKGTTTMAHMARADLPFYYALADAFTICDAYHCSLLGPTDPNRYYLWTGCTGNTGAAPTPVVDNAEAGYAWTTFPERLERAGIAWKVYQDIGDGLDAGHYWGWTADPAIGNYGDNALLYFRQYQAAQPGSALYEKARTGTQAKAGDDLLAQFRADIAAGTLPQVSWLVAPEALSEHPSWPANLGASYVGDVIDALTANPEVWARTVLLVTYDENDGFFDHVTPPHAPVSPALGLSNVAHDDEWFAGNATWQAGPYGLGPRVPLLAISPWSRGGFVNSQVFDHTSIIRFIEQRFLTEHPEVFESQISAWRRAVCGDLTSVFDFARPNAALPALPAAPARMAITRTPSESPTPPAVSAMPAQEPGLRRARALPYRLDASARFEAGRIDLQLRNDGDVAAVFQVHSRTASEPPRAYTVAAHSTLADTWALDASAITYRIDIHAPNGFLRAFAGRVDASDDAQVSLQADATAQVRVAIANPRASARRFILSDAYSGAVRHLEAAPAGVATLTWDASTALRWFDLRITDADDPAFLCQLAGYIENGNDGISEPRLGGWAES